MSNSMLDNLVDSYVTKHFRPGMSENEKNEIKRSVTDRVEDEIKKRIEEKQLSQMRQRVEAEEEQFRNHLYQERISDLITEAVFIAIFVGLLVNQATVLIDAFCTSRSDPLWCSALLILIFAVFILLIAKGLKWSRVLSAKKKKKESE